MRANEFIRDEDKLDEILPLIGMAAGGAARAAGGLIGRAAAGVGKAAVRGGAALARGAVTALAGDDDDEPEPADPNAKVGVQPSAGAVPASKAPTTPSATTTPTATPASGAPIASLKPGTSLKMPTNKGQMGDFKVTRVTANDVEIENPDKLKNPTEPDRIIYNKRDLAKAMGTK